MSILVDKKTKIIVQGITGHEGLFHAGLMLQYGALVVGGTRPGKGGEWVLDGKVPIFDSVRLACEATGAQTSVLFVPARYAADAMYEAADSGIKMIVCITEGIPARDMMAVCSYLERKEVLLIGPNCPGILTPGGTKIGIIPGEIATAGNIGVVSRSGTLTYEVLFALSRIGKGVSTCVGIGGDAIKGLNFVDVLSLFEEDPHTDQIILIGEIGGNDEERAAEFIAQKITKPVVAFIAGQSAPPGKRMGHAGAIIEGGTGTAAEKVKAFESVGVRVAKHPEEIAKLLL